jgi:aspartyl-tRNA(Asn)/glutamyl-tRNA(Gln) amidotransferase subunit A
VTGQGRFQEPGGDETAPRAAVRRLLEGAGLVADARQLAALVALHERLQPALEALRERLVAEDEPEEPARAGGAAPPGSPAGDVPFAPRPPDVDPRRVPDAPVGAGADPWYLPIASLHRAYRARELSPVEVTRRYLERIERLDGRLHAYITVTADLALMAARAAEARASHGALRGPLDGIPVGFKDLLDTAGIRTTAGSAVAADRVPARDADVVAALLAAGAVPLGKHTLHEFGSGGPSQAGPFPAARNPWDPGLVPGGSSSGSSAAVAAGLCAAALATDTGGSLRLPASYCGVVGFKPSRGRVSRRGLVPLAWTLDHVGPLARTVEDAALVVHAIAAPDPAGPVPDPGTGLRAGLRGVEIGAPLALVERAPDLHPETLAAYREALAVLERLGATVRPVELPEAEHVDTAVRVIVGAESLAAHRRTVREGAARYGRGFYQTLLEGALLGGTDYVDALRMRARIGRAMRALMQEVDLLALPTTAHPAWDFATEARYPGWLRSSFTRVFNLTGQPAVSVPCGLSAAGLPLGLQLAGRAGADAAVLAAAHAFEAATGWWRRHPPEPPA